MLFDGLHSMKLLLSWASGEHQKVYCWNLAFGPDAKAANEKRFDGCTQLGLELERGKAIKGGFTVWKMNTPIPCMEIFLGLPLRRSWSGPEACGARVGRKNYLFCGSDTGERAAIIYSLIETCKLNHIDQQRYLHYILERIANHPINRIDELLPWILIDQLQGPAQVSQALAA